MAKLSTEPSIREAYQKHSVSAYYQGLSTLYENPHLPAIHQLLSNYSPTIPENARILDLCAGSGQLTSWLNRYRPDVSLVGCEPYLRSQYEMQTKKPCYAFDFKQLARSVLPETFDLVLCSYAFHLCEPSLRAMVCWQLSQVTSHLWLFAPNKNTGVVSPFIAHYHDKEASTHFFQYHLVNR